MNEVHDIELSIVQILQEWNILLILIMQQLFDKTLSRTFSNFTFNALKWIVVIAFTLVPLFVLHLRDDS